MKHTITIFCFFLYSYCFSQGIKKDSVYQKAIIHIYKDPSASITIFNQLLTHYDKVEDKAELYWQISTAYIAKRDYDHSLKYMNKAQELLSEIKSPKTRMQILVSIAVLYQQMEVYTKSLEMLDKAEKISKEIPDDSASKIHLLGNIYAIRGMIYRNQSSPEMALEKFRNAKNNYLKIVDKVSAKANISVILYNMGYTYLDKDELKEAIKSFEESIKYARLAKANSLEAFALKGLAETLFKEEKFNVALSTLQQAEKLAETVGDLVLNEGIYKGFADNFLALDQLDQYQVYNKKYVQVRFERQQNELESINSEIDNRIEFYQLQRDEEEKSNKLFLIVFSILGLLLLLGLGYFIIKTNKENKILQQKILQKTSTS